MKSIYIGVCKTRDDEKFKESFRNLTDSICSKYSICQMVIKDTFLPEAQNQIAKSFIESDYDYLLFLDDDHWGHTSEMVDCLIEANTYVATIKTYSRHYPYHCVILNTLNNEFVVPIEKGEGYVQCDLTGFPMTLIRRDVFDLLERPYFRPFEAEGRNWNSDVDFFNRLKKIGIKPVGCFQHTLNHDKVTKDNVHQLRRDEQFFKNNVVWGRMLKDIENGVFVVK